MFENFWNLITQVIGELQQIDFVEYTKSQLSTNQFASGALFAGVLGAVWAYTKKWPIRIWGFISSRLKRLMYHSITLEENDDFIQDFSQFLSEHYSNKLRNMQIRSDEDVKGKLKIHLHHLTDSFSILHNGLPLFISKRREKIERTSYLSKPYYDKYVITSLFGKKHLNSFIKKAVNNRPLPENRKDIIRKYLPSSNNWRLINEYTNKKVDKIFFEGKEDIIKDIDDFSENPRMYESKGIEWYRGYLFHGPPGSGKTSFAKALAHHTDRKLYVINLASTTDSQFQKLFTEMGSNACLLLDDIDVCVPTREKETEKDSGVKLSTLLSHLSGASSRSDLIVIATTNHVDKLDEALVRKGRFDVIKNISYPDSKSIIDYMMNFYSIEDSEKIDQTLLNDNTLNNKSISMVDVEDICIKTKDINKALEETIKLMTKSKTKKPRSKPNSNPKKTSKDTKVKK